MSSDWFDLNKINEANRQAWYDEVDELRTIYVARGELAMFAKLLGLPISEFAELPPADPDTSEEQD